MKTKGVWSWKNSRQKDQGHTQIWKSLIFLLSAKQTRQGKKAGVAGFWANIASSLKSKNTLKNPVCSGENLTGGTLKVAWTCSVCPTLWLLRLSPAARQLRWYLAITRGCCLLFQDISTWRQSGGVFSMGHFFLLVTGSAEPFLLIIFF